MRSWMWFASLAVVASLAAGNVWADNDLNYTESIKFCSNQCAPQRSVVAGVEATFLRPGVEGARIFYDNAVDINSGDLANFQDWQGAPRVWLGVENQCGWGARIRYWTFGTYEHNGFVNTATGDAAVADLELKAYTLDFEGTKRWRNCCWDVLGTCGLRYAYREIFNSLAVHEGSAFGFASLSDKAGGTGITFALEGARRLGDSDFAGVAGARGSLLLGEQSNTFAGGVSDGPSDAARFHVDSTLSIFELTLGVRWTHRIACLCTDVFSQVNFEYQHWNNEPTRSFTYAARSADAVLYGHSIGQAVDFTGIAWSMGFKR